MPSPTDASTLSDNIENLIRYNRASDSLHIVQLTISPHTTASQSRSLYTPEAIEHDIGGRLNLSRIILEPLNLSANLTFIYGRLRFALISGISAEQSDFDILTLLNAVKISAERLGYPHKILVNTEIKSGEPILQIHLN